MPEVVYKTVQNEQGILQNPTGWFVLMNIDRKKSSSDFPEEVNFCPGHVKREIQWPGGQVKLDSVSCLVSLSEEVSVIK